MQQKSEIEILCHNIKALRMASKLTPEDMAKLLGISPSALAQLENGILSPDLECAFLFQIQKHWKIPPAQIFTKEIPLLSPDQQE